MYWKAVMGDLSLRPLPPEHPYPLNTKALTGSMAIRSRQITEGKAWCGWALQGLTVPTFSLVKAGLPLSPKNTGQRPWFYCKCLPVSFSVGWGRFRKSFYKEKVYFQLLSVFFLSRKVVSILKGTKSSFFAPMYFVVYLASLRVQTNLNLVFFSSAENVYIYILLG